MQETHLGQEDPLEKEMATCDSPGNQPLEGGGPDHTAPCQGLRLPWRSLLEEPGRNREYDLLPECEAGALFQIHSNCYMLRWRGVGSGRASKGSREATGQIFQVHLLFL